MVKIMVPNPLKMDDLGGKTTPIFGSTPIYDHPNDDLYHTPCQLVVSDSGDAPHPDHAGDLEGSC